MSDNFKHKAFDDGGSDELLRKSMDGYRVEPRPGLWKGISRKLLWNELIRFNFTNLSPRTWIAGVSGVLLIATVLYFGTKSAAPETPSAPDLSYKPGVAASSPVAVSRPVPGSAAMQKPATQSVETEMKQDEPVASGTKESGSVAVAQPSQITPAPAIGHKSQPSRAVEQALSVSEPVHTESAPAEKVMTAVIPGISPVIPIEASLYGTPAVSDSIITISTAGGMLKFRQDKPSSNQFFSAGLGFTPEISFYSQPESYSKINFWLNGDITWHFSRFSLSTGVGLGYVFDQGQYVAEYKSNDSIGYYYGVTSYSVGTNDEIIYHTETIGVYDSLQHLSDFRAKNRYTYVQVPLLVGYRLFESNRASLMFQAGPAISVLLGTHKADPAVEYRNARVMRVDENTPARVQTSWQIWANLYFELRVTRQISLYFEPTFKYYLSPSARKENVSLKAPVSVGLGIGLQFNFGQKKTNP